MDSFITYMKLQGLSEKTINEHVRGIVMFQKKGGLLNWSEDKTVSFIRDHYNKDYYQKNKEELKKKRRDRYYKTSERLKYKKTRTKIVKNYIEEK